jgi:hypothetical protein
MRIRWSVWFLSAAIPLGVAVGSASCGGSNSTNVGTVEGGTDGTTESGSGSGGDGSSSGADAHPEGSSSGGDA